ncbi:MAG: O-antigen ligase family protein [Bacteroidetes bacterium]|nr:O-antigen ligase family protein [Bacteroidota bacterium]
MLKYIAIYYLITNLYNNRKRFVILSWILIVSAAFLSIGGVIYLYNIHGSGLETRLGLPEVGIGVNYIGFFTITAIFFCLTNFFREVNLQFKVISIACVFVSLVATILTGTRGTFLGLFLPLILLFHRHKKKGAVVALIFLVIIGFTPVKQIFTPNAIINRIKTEPRKAIWYSYWKVIKDHPITGIGYGRQTYNTKIFGKYNMQNLHAPHNTFIDVTVRLGIVGLVLFLYIVFIFVRMGWQLAQYGNDDFIKTWALFLQATFVSFLIQGMFADMLLGVQIIIFFILMAMMTVLWRINEDHHG